MDIIKTYFSKEDFELNYKKDLSDFLNIYNEANEKIYIQQLIEKYEYVIEQHSIYLNFNLPISGKYYTIDELGSFQSIKDIKNNYDFDGASRTIEEYFPFEQQFIIDNTPGVEQFNYCIDNFLATSNKGVYFDKVRYRNYEYAYNSILKILYNKESLIDSSTNSELLIEPLEFNLNQTDIVHFFDLLVDADIIKEPTDAVHKNKGGFYGKLASFFVAKGRKTINPDSAKSTISNKRNKNTRYSKEYFQTLINLKNTIEKRLNINDNDSGLL